MLFASICHALVVGFVVYGNVGQWAWQWGDGPTSSENVGKLTSESAGEQTQEVLQLEEERQETLGGALQHQVAKWQQVEAFRLCSSPPPVAAALQLADHVDVDAWLEEEMDQQAGDKEAALRAIAEQRRGPAYQPLSDNATGLEHGVTALTAMVSAAQHRFKGWEAMRRTAGHSNELLMFTHQLGKTRRAIQSAALMVSTREGLNTATFEERREEFINSADFCTAVVRAWMVGEGLLERPGGNPTVDAAAYAAAVQRATAAFHRVQMMDAQCEALEPARDYVDDEVDDIAPAVDDADDFILEAAWDP